MNALIMNLTLYRELQFNALAYENMHQFPVGARGSGISRRVCTRHVSKSLGQGFRDVSRTNTIKVGL